MPDHLHLAMRVRLSIRRRDVALAFINNLAHVLRMGAVWRPGYYVGTFGEYNMNAIRSAVRTTTPASLSGR